MLRRYFSASWQSTYLAAKGSTPSAQNAARAAESSKSKLTIMMSSVMYISLLIAAFLFTIGGRVGLDLGENRKLLCGRTRYKLYSATGTVLSPSKDREVRTHISGGGGTGYVSGGTGYSSQAPITSSTTTITHVQFFLKEAEEKERPIQITDVNLALREGQKLSVVWAIKEGKDAGHYFLFRNHTTQKTDYNESVLLNMLTPSMWLVLICSLPLLLLPSIPFYIVRSVVVARRKNFVMQQFAERLIPQLDGR